MMKHLTKHIEIKSKIHIFFQRLKYSKPLNWLSLNTAYTYKVFTNPSRDTVAGDAVAILSQTNMTFESPNWT